jgi:hypothetical protein
VFASTWLDGHPEYDDVKNFGETTYTGDGIDPGLAPAPTG